MGISRSLLAIVGILVGSVGAAVSTVYAGAFGLDEQGAAAMGRANAFAAQADDPTALFYNPAGIGQLSGTQISVGTTLIVPSTTFENANSGISTDTNAALFYPSTLYLVHEIRRDLHVGLGIFTPFGLSTEWPSDWEGRYVTTFSEITTYYFNPNITWSPSPRFHVAAGVSYVPSSVTLRNKLDLGAPPDGELEIKADGDGLGYNAATLIDLPWQSSIGISYRSPVKIGYSGDVKSNPSVLSGPVTSSLTLPPMLTVGLANRATEAITLEADLQWVGWSKIQSITITDSSSSIPPQVKNWTDSYSLRFGVEHSRGPVTLRAGYSYDPTPVPPDTIEPSLPDSDKHTLAIGGGYRFGKATIDLAYMFIRSNDRNANPTAAAGGTSFVQQGKFSTQVHDVGIGIGDRF